MRTPLSSSSSSSGHIKVSDGDSSIQDSSRSVTPSPSEVRKSVSSSVKVSSSMATASEIVPEVDPINKVYLAYESLNQKSYLFDYFIKSGSGKHVKVRVDVSGEQVRFELLEKTSKLPWQQMSQTTQRLVDCTPSTKEASSRKGQRRFAHHDSNLFCLFRSGACSSDLRKSTGIRWCPRLSDL